MTLKIKKAAIPDASNSRWTRPKHQRVHSATMPRHHVMVRKLSIDYYHAYFLSLHAFQDKNYSKLY